MAFCRRIRKQLSNCCFQGKAADEMKSKGEINFNMEWNIISSSPWLYFYVSVTIHELFYDPLNIGPDFRTTHEFV